MDPASEPAPLRKLGRYRLCFEIASGGMASVYLARQESDAGFEKIVAVKVVHPHLAGDAAFTEMFLDEARLAARIDHPHVCSVFDFGQVDGLYFLAMEYLQGESLLHVSKEVARRKDRADLSRLPWYVARIFADACEGLHAAHELADEDGEPLGVVHRDVSPQNLILTYEGSVKVVDFGVAKAASQLHTTEAGKIKGKLAYVSPEQLKNKPLDRRTDVWALGVCLWESLTLKRLFRRDSEAATLMAVAHDPIPLPSEVRSWIPPDLDQIVMGALCRDVDARTPSARELGRELSKFLTSSGVNVGMAELAEWMQSMFATERAERRELIRKARTAEVAVLLPRPSGEVSSTDSVAASVSLELPRPVPAPPPAPPRRPARLIAPLIVLAIAGALGIGYVAARMLPATGAEERAGSEAALAAARTPATRGAQVGDVVPSGAQIERGAPSAGAPEERTDPALSATVGTEAAAPEEPAPPSTTAEPAALQERAAQEPAGSEEVATPRARTPRAGSSAPGPRPERTAAASAGGEGSEPTPPAAPGTGYVVVLTSGGGWAEVFEGARSLGRTPLRVPLAAGTHRLRILPNGEEPAHVETVEVARGEDVLLRVRIEEP